MSSEFPRCRRTDWAEAERWADTVATQVRRAGSVPESIVALTRGGWVPARLMADRLGVKRLVAVRAQHWGITATRTGKAELTEGLSGPIRGDSVLVVDDITDTGESLELATAYVRDSGARSVESAAFVHIAHSKFVPTYYAEEIPRDQWIWVVFPWNYWEDLATLASRAYAEARDIEGARKLLQERCGLDVPVQDVTKV
ncbi:MAG TPA: phosphoribosyltransferase, partial [Thermoplasmata archaeon]|nr:phosphoribosyltransferase [Thermoplasmata archaeon]